MMWRLIREPIETAIIDGFVQLNERPGLGQHFYEQLERRVPVVGVAKTPFAGAAPVEVLRGHSKTPLYVTSIGMDPESAADHVRKMHGQYRIPTLLKRVDRLARTAIAE